MEVTDVVTGEKVHSDKFVIEANGRIQLASLPERDGQGMFLIRYEVEGTQYANHYLYGRPPFNLSTYKDNLKKTNIYILNTERR